MSEVESVLFSDVRMGNGEFGWVGVVRIWMGFVGGKVGK